MSLILSNADANRAGLLSAGGYQLIETLAGTTASASAADLLGLRSSIINYVWGRNGLPLSALPTSVTDPMVDTTGTPQASWPSDCVRMTELVCTLPRSGSYKAWIAHPALTPAYQGGGGRRNELVLFVGGHSANWLSGNAAYLLYGLLRYGFTVARCDMPAFDLNAANTGFTSMLGSAITISNNHDMSALETDGVDGLRIFLDGHIAVLNHCMGKLGFKRARLVGLSGGGWTAEWLAAVDPRITAVHSVMGSLPFSMRAARGGPGQDGDWEQLPARGFWSAARTSQEAIYKLACLESGRRLIKYHADHEPIFPTASLRADLTSMANDIASSVDGSFSISYDETTSVHDYTVGTGAIDNIVRSTAGFSGQILADLIST